MKPFKADVTVSTRLGPEAILQCSQHTRTAWDRKEVLAVGLHPVSQILQHIFLQQRKRAGMPKETIPDARLLWHELSDSATWPNLEFARLQHVTIVSLLHFALNFVSDDLQLQLHLAAPNKRPSTTPPGTRSSTPASSRAGGG